jgi:hypothetical protein
MAASGNPDLEQQLDMLVALVTAHGADIEALQDQALAAHERADAAERRADAAEQRSDEIEARSSIDREMIGQLQADGVLSKDHAAQLDQALISSRTIGAAIGILMASRQLSQEQAFVVLKEASQRSNRKLRDLAAELVEATSSAEGP